MSSNEEINFTPFSFYIKFLSFFFLKVKIIFQLLASYRQYSIKNIFYILTISQIKHCIIFIDIFFKAPSVKILSLIYKYLFILYIFEKIPKWLGFFFFFVSETINFENIAETLNLWLPKMSIDVRGSLNFKFTW